MTLFLVSVVVGILTAFVIERLHRRHARRMSPERRCAGDITREEALHRAWPETREEPIKPWTPLEREALGVNDTDALIARIDSEINAAAYEKWREDNPDTGVEIIHTLNGDGTMTSERKITADKITAGRITAERIYDTHIEWDRLAQEVQHEAMRGRM